MKIIPFILCWLFLGFIGFIINQICFFYEMKDEEDVVTDFMVALALGFAYFVSVIVVAIGTYLPKILKPFVLQLMKIIQKIRRK